MQENRLDVPRETKARLKLYAEALSQWNASINLVAAPDWSRHFEDSLQLRPYCSGRCADLGSGAGFPGLVLAAAGIGSMTLIESDRRKCAFLREVASMMKIAPTIVSSRIEDVSDRFDTILSRALTQLDGLLEYAHPRLEGEGRCVFPKGRNYDKELEKAERRWQFTLDVKPSDTSPDAVILLISNLEPR